MLKYSTNRNDVSGFTDSTKHAAVASTSTQSRDQYADNKEKRRAAKQRQLDKAIPVYTYEDLPKMTNTPEALRKVKSAKESYQRQKIQNKLSFKPLKGGKKGPEWRGMGKKKQIEYQEKEEETERQLKLKMATNRLGGNRNRYEDGSDFERKREQR
jgi:hypothetical protein